MSNKYKNLTRDTLLFAISNFGSKILVFLLTPLYTSMLLTEEYGIADLINTTINFIYPILTLAIADATLRYALDKEADKTSVLHNCFFFTFISCIILLACYPVVKFFDATLQKYWLYFVVTYILFNIHNGLSNFVKGLGQTKLFAIQGLLQTLSIIISNILFLVVFKKGLEGYLISIIIGHLIPSIFMFFTARIYKYIFPLKIDMSLTKDMLKYSIPMIPTLLAWSISTSISKYMIIAKTGLSDSGIYGAAQKIPTLFTTVVSVFTQAWQISAIENMGDLDEGEYHSKIYGGLNILSLIGCMCIIPLSQVLAKILFAEVYFTAWQYVPMLTVSAMFSSHAGFLAAAFRAYKKTKILFVSVFVGSVLNIILNVIFLEVMGTIGAAFASAISFFVVWLIRFITSQSIVKVTISIPKTALSYMLLFLSAVYFSFSAKYTFAILIISMGIICVLNINDLKSIVLMVMRLINKTKKSIKPQG